MIFVDYGSTKENSLQIQKLLANYPFCNYFYSDTRGWLWNRAVTLNIGARLAETPFVFFTDIDIIYEAEFVAKLQAHTTENSFLIPHCMRVPKGFNNWSALLIGKDTFPFSSMRGFGLGCYPKKVLEAVGGYDEQFAYWGCQDIDLVERMTRYGIGAQRLQEVRVYHQWHPQSIYKIPYGVVFHNLSWLYRGRDDERICANNSLEWGRRTSSADRPIYAHIDPDISAMKPGEIPHFAEAYSVAQVNTLMGKIASSRDELWAFSKAKENGRMGEIMNKILRRFGWKVEHSVGYMEDFINGFLLSVPSFFRDYYIDCEIGGKKYSVFLR
jgi:hypothetical protein